MFRDCRQDVNGEPVRLGEIDGNEINIRLHQPRDEMDVSFQPVNFSYQELGAMYAAERQCTSQFRPIGPRGHQQSSDKFFDWRSQLVWIRRRDEAKQRVAVGNELNIFLQNPYVLHFAPFDQRAEAVVLVFPEEFQDSLGGIVTMQFK
jgi:hypothetical protein